MDDDDESYDQEPSDSKVERKIIGSDESTGSFVEVTGGDQKIALTTVIHCTSENNLKTVISTSVGYFKTNLVENPVKIEYLVENIWRAACKAIVCGRPLEIETLDSTIEEATNQIIINSYHVFKSAK